MRGMTASLQAGMPDGEDEDAGEPGRRSWTAHPPNVRVVPVLDLSAGRVVRALRGERASYRPVESRLVEGASPLAVAAALLQATRGPHDPVLYVADLDAIAGGAVQVDVLRALLAAQQGLTLWLDAGFVDPAAAARCRTALGDGTRVRPVFGSESLADAASLLALRDDPTAILSLDRRGDETLDRGGVSGRPDAWPATVIVMTLDRVGSGAGPDLSALARAQARAPGRTWVGAGGVRDTRDLRAAAAAGAAAWLVASALHDGTLAM
jgi:phosphoribosylformimino-5-aminoimidazole carboxamide ribotide isomerase